MADYVFINKIIYKKGRFIETYTKKTRINNNKSNFVFKIKKFMPETYSSTLNFDQPFKI